MLAAPVSANHKYIPNVHFHIMCLVRFTLHVNELTWEVARNLLTREPGTADRDCLSTFAIRKPLDIFYGTS